MLRLRIKEVAQQKRISMTKLSHRSEVSYNTLKLLYRDPYHSFNSETLVRLARALQVSPLDLLEDVPQEDVSEGKDATADENKK